MMTKINNFTKGDRAIIRKGFAEYYRHHNSGWEIEDVLTDGCEVIVKAPTVFIPEINEWTVDCGAVDSAWGVNIPVELLAKIVAPEATLAEQPPAAEPGAVASDVLEPTFQFCDMEDCDQRGVRKFDKGLYCEDHYRLEVEEYELRHSQHLLPAAPDTAAQRAEPFAEDEVLAYMIGVDGYKHLIGNSATALCGYTHFTVFQSTTSHLPTCPRCEGKRLAIDYAKSIAEAVQPEQPVASAETAAKRVKLTDIQWELVTSMRVRDARWSSPYSGRRSVCCNSSEYDGRTLEVLLNKKLVHEVAYKKGGTKIYQLTDAGNEAFFAHIATQRDAS